MLHLQILQKMENGMLVDLMGEVQLEQMVKYIQHKLLILK